MINIKLRTSGKAIIIKNNKLLCSKHQDSNGIYYLIPGGGQNPGENLIQTVKREVFEELSINVEVHAIRWIREYIGKNHEPFEHDSNVHRVEFMFDCAIIGNDDIKMGPEPDLNQIGFEWIDLKNIKNFRIYPSQLKDLLTINPITEESVKDIYLGDI